MLNRIPSSTSSRWLGLALRWSGSVRSSDIFSIVFFYLLFFVCLHDVCSLAVNHCAHASEPRASDRAKRGQRLQLRCTKKKCRKNKASMRNNARARVREHDEHTSANTRFQKNRIFMHTKNTKNMIIPPPDDDDDVQQPIFNLRRTKMSRTTRASARHRADYSGAKNARTARGPPMPVSGARTRAKCVWEWVKLCGMDYKIYATFNMNLITKYEICFSIHFANNTPSFNTVLTYIILRARIIGQHTQSINFDVVIATGYFYFFA